MDYEKKEVIIEGQMGIISQEKKYPVITEYLNGKIVKRFDYNNPYYEVELIVRGKEIVHNKGVGE